MREMEFDSGRTRELKRTLSQGKSWGRVKKKAVALVESGANPHEESLITEILRHDDAESLELLFEHGLDPAWRDYYGAAIGHLSVRHDAPECFDAWLAKAGKKAVHWTTNTGSSMAHYSVYGEERKTFKTLDKWLAKGGDHNAENARGLTPLQVLELDKSKFNIKRERLKKKLEALKK